MRCVSPHCSQHVGETVRGGRERERRRGAGGRRHGPRAVSLSSVSVPSFAVFASAAVRLDGRSLNIIYYRERFCQTEIAPLMHFSKPLHFESWKASAGVEEVNKSVV